MLQTITPLDVDKMEVDDILKYVSDSNPNLPSAKNRLKVVKLVFQCLGLTLSPDIAMIMIAHPKAMQVIASAGAGKTTISQVKVIMEKLVYSLMTGKQLYGNRVLCIVYNKHNVKPMMSTQTKMVSRLKNSGFAGLENVDDLLSAQTLHSFCNSWKDEYEIETGLSGCKVISHEGVANDIMSASFETVCQIAGERHFVKIADLVALYRFSKERMLDFDDPEVLKSNSNVRLPAELVKMTFRSYENLKKRRKVYDYVDLLTSILELMRTNERARERIQGYYDYVLCDECQDFTPLMLALVKMICGDKTPVMFMGDEDQTIYEFNGADVNNILSFSEIFDGGEVYTMTSNRRCPEKIVRLASVILEDNEFRFGKKLRWIKDGGTIEAIPYSSDKGQIVSVIKRLENMSLEEQEKTIICYRDKIYSSLLTDMLEERGVPFHVISGNKPFSHELYKVCFDVLDLLFDPFDPDLQLNLYKALPISRSEIENVLGYDSSRKRFKTDRGRVHFATLDFGKHSGYKKFTEELIKLANLTKYIGSRPLCEIFPEVFSLICAYYWEYKKSNSKNIDYDNMYTEKVSSYFGSSTKTYHQFFEEYRERLDKVRGFENAETGVALSTFHSLKGLEYDNVIMIFMDDAVFPSRDSLRPELTELERQMLRESETRLCHVAVTRSKKNLYVYYNHNCPSYYVKKMLKFLGQPEAKPVTVKKDIDLSSLLEPNDISLNVASTSLGQGSFLNSALGRLK